ncbi:putative serine/threonine-protein kinase PIX7 [Trifolium repens]|nr:putative serine/threonine-protein kinase PIX7 [Trifolium repens]
MVVGTPKSSTSGVSRSPTAKNISPNLYQFTYQDLKVATKNFLPELFLGEGGFGSVYKGWITLNERSRLEIPIAVKTLDANGLQGHKEWEAEINHLGALWHPNLVKLIGYCIEDEHRVLVYEFMPRGSLENYLFNRHRTPLTWGVRMKIMLGAAKGLAFLHEESKKPLIYRDFKTSNILLDSEFNAKLSDFGLAKDAPVGDKTHVSTQVIGTRGYVDPEYVMTGHLTSKNDVYSFGVVLLEMLTGRKAIDQRRPKNEQFLVEWVKPFLKQHGGEFYQIMDPNVEGQYTKRAAYKAIKIAVNCIYRDLKSRPLMSEVVKELKNILDYNDMPGSPLPPPPLSFKGSDAGASSSHGGGSANKYDRNVGSSSSAMSTPNRFQGSPLMFTPPFLSPTPPRGGNP